MRWDWLCVRKDLGVWDFTVSLNSISSCWASRVGFFCKHPML
ncbi:hypothetical protein LINGRAHAP2_LOCUS10930 [Linum grandiflorum]